MSDLTRAHNAVIEQAFEIAKQKAREEHARNKPQPQGATPPDLYPYVDGQDGKALRLRSDCPNCKRLKTLRLQQNGNVVCLYRFANYMYGCGYTWEGVNVDDARQLNYENEAPGTRNHAGAPVDLQRGGVARLQVGQGRGSRALRNAMRATGNDQTYRQQKRHTFESAIVNTLVRLGFNVNAFENIIVQKLMETYDNYVGMSKDNIRKVTVVLILADALSKRLTVEDPLKVRRLFAEECIKLKILKPASKDEHEKYVQTIIKGNSQSLKKLHTVLGKDAAVKNAEAIGTHDKMSKNLQQLIASLTGIAATPTLQALADAVARMRATNTLTSLRRSKYADLYCLYVAVRQAGFSTLPGFANVNAYQAHVQQRLQSQNVKLLRVGQEVAKIVAALAQVGPEAIQDENNAAAFERFTATLTPLLLQHLEIALRPFYSSPRNQNGRGSDNSDADKLAQTLVTLQKNPTLFAGRGSTFQWVALNLNKTLTLDMASRWKVRPADLVGPASRWQLLLRQVGSLVDTVGVMMVVSHSASGSSRNAIDFSQLGYPLSRAEKQLVLDVLSHQPLAAA